MNHQLIGEELVIYEVLLNYGMESSDVDFIYRLDGGKMIRDTESREIISWMFEDENLDNNTNKNDSTDENVSSSSMYSK